jgi:hypothetical protein
MAPHAWFGPHWVDLPGWNAIEWLTFFIGIGTFASAVFIGATAVLARGALADAKRTRHGQVVVELARQWSDPPMLESRLRFAEISNAELLALAQRMFGGATAAPGPDAKRYFELTRLPDLIETIAALESEGVVSTRLIHKLWGPVIVSQWLGWRDAIFEMRKHGEQDAEGAYLYFQRLAAAMRRLDTELHRAGRYYE